MSALTCNTLTRRTIRYTDAQTGFSISNATYHLQHLGTRQCYFWNLDCQIAKQIILWYAHRIFIRLLWYALKYLNKHWVGCDLAQTENTPQGWFTLFESKNSSQSLISSFPCLRVSSSSLSSLSLLLRALRLGGSRVAITCNEAAEIVKYWIH